MGLEFKIRGQDFRGILWIQELDLVFRFQVSGFGFLISVPGFQVRVLDFGFWISVFGFGMRFSDPEFCVG